MARRIHVYTQRSIRDPGMTNFRDWADRYRFAPCAIAHNTAADAPAVGNGVRDVHERASALHDGAVELARHHWNVLLLNGKIPLIPNPHPMGSSARAACRGECGQLGHGLFDATDNLTVVSLLWTRYPGSNIGARIPEGTLMIDVDPRHGGLESWAALQNRYGEFPECLTTISGRGDGGVHVYIRRPPGMITSRRLGPGIDLKTSNGYAVMPPSIHPNTGLPYVAVDGRVVAPPKWFANLVIERPTELKSRRTHRARFSSPNATDSMSESLSWAAVLAPHGWECVDLASDEDGSRWLHPSATSACSATIRHGCLFVYSPNTPFEVTEPGKPRGYTKFRAYAVLNHRGDRGAAARALSRVVGS